jgi:ketosteroid isomerase-like protein
MLTTLWPRVTIGGPTPRGCLGRTVGATNPIAEGGYTVPAQKPEDCDYLVAEYINSGNVQAAVDLYEPTATFVAEPGKPVSGHAAIREVMAGFVAGKPRIEMKVPIVVQSGDLALTVSDYTITSTGPDGTQTSSSARGTDTVDNNPSCGDDFF